MKYLRLVFLGALIACFPSIATSDDCYSSCDAQYNQCMWDVCGGEDSCNECDAQHQGCLDSCSAPAEEEQVVELQEGEAQAYGGGCWSICQARFGARYWSWWYLRYMYLRACMTSGRVTYCAYSS
jgi:hypothetical protein